MKRKKKDSAAQTILRRFLAPFSRYKKPDQDLGQFWDVLFGADDKRDLLTFRAKKPLRLPGLYFVADNMRIQGIGPRDVKKGELLIARVNLETGAADVEHSVKMRENVFALTSTAWNWLRPQLQPVNMKARR